VVVPAVETVFVFAPQCSPPVGNLFRSMQLDEWIIPAASATTPPLLQLERKLDLPSCSRNLQTPQQTPSGEAD